MLVPIATSCASSRASIRSLHVLACKRFQGVTYSEDGRIASIDVQCSGSTSWTRYNFKRDTAFFEQSMSRSGANTPTRQNISFSVDGVTQALRRSIISLKRQCCLVVVVGDAIGQYMLAGVSSYADGLEFRDLVLETLTATTGQDRVADANTADFTLSATVNCLAPYLIGNPVDISTDCTRLTVFGTAEDGDTVFGTVEDGDTVFGP